MWADGFSIRNTQINILVAHNRSIFTGLQVIVQNQFLYGEFESIFYFRNLPVDLHYKHFSYFSLALNFSLLCVTSFAYFISS